MGFLHKKNTKDFILQSSLSEIHLFQDHSADNASVSRSDQERGRGEKLKKICEVYACTQEAWEWKGNIFNHNLWKH